MGPEQSRRQQSVIYLLPKSVINEFDMFSTEGNSKDERFENVC